MGKQINSRSTTPSRPVENFCFVLALQVSLTPVEHEFKSMRKVTDMLRFLFAAGLVSLAVAGWAANTIRPADLTGGGSVSTVGNTRLSGAICDYGVGGSGVSQNASYKLSIGFYPSLGPIVTKNVADPAWLKVSEAERERSIQTAAWRDSDSNLHAPINLTGWQL
jgi:hypothetical protein